ncbi:MAG: ammonia-forming cytochrome c nitrite reductase subunit c552, partial [Syntrophothermus sp.]
VEDVKKIKRKKPSASCWTCKSSDIPGIIQRMGPKYYTASFDEVGKEVKHNIACLNCHDPRTMELRLSQPALISALERQGKDVSKLTRQEMRTYVCAQCHVEYYFKPKTLEVTFPWDKGMKIDNIEAYYKGLGNFKDWVHPRSGADMIKIQHPETEFFSNSTHASAGVACADCHMPYMKEGTAKISSHWWTSPLKTIEQSCQTCHRQSAEELKKRVLYTQERTAELLKTAGEANVAAIQAIEAAAKVPGANQKLLAEARQLHRSSQMRWDWVAAENSTGFHNPQEALHTLGKSIDLARQAQLKAQQSAGSAR